MESLPEKIKRVTSENISIVPYDSNWPMEFKKEKDRLLSILPNQLITRVEHFGSTAIPELAAKPIIDILIETPSLEKVKVVVVPILENQEYEYFWRPTYGEKGLPFYAWFIKRNKNGIRTHHIHIVEPGFQEHWTRLLFRDYLILHSETRQRYQELKYSLADKYPNDRIKYSKEKAIFINKIMETITNKSGV